ncbi:unnamed protein product [Cercospora beticola]|nr:unnamed protein product [Cercospora beticola]
MIRVWRYASQALAGALAFRLYFPKQHNPSNSTGVLLDRFELLMERANKSFSAMISARTDTLATTVEAYMLRRHQSPPPGFAEWYRLAVQHDAVIVESFWDPIYEDLDPFSKYSAHELGVMAHIIATTSSPLIDGYVIQNGSVVGTCEPANLPCLQVQAMLGRIAQTLPDLVLPFHGHASPRVLADTSTAAHGHQNLRWLNDSPLFTIPHDRLAVMQRACGGNSSLAMFPGDDGSRAIIIESVRPRTIGVHATALGDPAVHDPQRWGDVCSQPRLLQMHGALVRPNCLNITTELMPLFSPAKVAGIETAIRYPDSIYWSREPGYHADASRRAAWKAKSNKAFWRGANTGGGHGRENWQSFHRHRFVALTNATYLSSIKEGQQQGGAEKGMPITDRKLSSLFHPDVHAVCQVMRMHSIVHLPGVCKICNIVFLENGRVRILSFVVRPSVTEDSGRGATECVRDLVVSTVWRRPAELQRIVATVILLRFGNGISASAGQVLWMSAKSVP